MHEIHENLNPTEITNHTVFMPNSLDRMRFSKQQMHDKGFGHMRLPYSRYTVRGAISVK